MCVLNYYKIGYIFELEIVFNVCEEFGVFNR